MHVPDQFRVRRARNVTTTAEVRGVIGDALSDHFSHPNSVCAHPDPRDRQQWETLASAIVDLTTGEYLVAPGNPCMHAYEPDDATSGPNGPRLGRRDGRVVYDVDPQD